MAKKNKKTAKKKSAKKKASRSSTESSAPPSLDSMYLKLSNDIFVMPPGPAREVLFEDLGNMSAKISRLNEKQISRNTQLYKQVVDAFNKANKEAKKVLEELKKVSEYVETTAEVVSALAKLLASVL